MKTSLRHALIIALLATVLTACKTQTPSPTTSSSPVQPEPEKTTQPPIERAYLSGNITNVSLYPVPNKRENLAVSVVVAVNNAGATANAQDWTLAVNTPGRSDLRGIQPVHVNGIVEMPGMKGKRVDLAKEDLAIKSKDTPLAKGATLSGILTFVLAKTSAADLSNKATLVVRFKDSQGNSYETKAVNVGAKR